jgi:hypothetical protein
MKMKNSLLYYIFLCAKFGLSPLRYSELLSYYPDWKKSFEDGRNSVSDEMPWLTFPALQWLNSKQMNDWSVFEYGGGGSTLYFTKRAKQVITVEHDPEWFAILAETLKKRQRENWTGLHILPEKLTGKRGNPEDPHLYLSTDEHFLTYEFKKYASAIDSFETFDLILVDGRARNGCILHALPKLKSGSYLVIDNAERQHYTKYFQDEFTNHFEVILDSLAPVPYTRFISKTLILRKK